MATKQYNRLTDGPQTKINRSRLAPEERVEVRYLQVTRHSDSPPTYDGQFTTVYYLEGDERAAAERFVEENRDQLEAIDFSHPDPVQESVPREVYDWILHHLGERELRKYRTVVYERRRDGTEWIIDRTTFEQHPSRRYTTSENSAAVATSRALADVYRELDETITEAELAAQDAINGVAKYVLEYYRVAGPFDCEPITVDGSLAVRKCNHE